jgi:hypothetical protein
MGRKEAQATLEAYRKNKYRRGLCIMKFCHSDRLRDSSLCAKHTRVFSRAQNGAQERAEAERTVIARCARCRLSGHTAAECDLTIWRFASARHSVEEHGDKKR